MIFFNVVAGGDFLDGLNAVQDNLSTAAVGLVKAQDPAVPVFSRLDRIQDRRAFYSEEGMLAPQLWQWLNAGDTGQRLV